MTQNFTNVSNLFMPNDYEYAYKMSDFIQFAITWTFVDFGIMSTVSLILICASIGFVLGDTTPRRDAEVSFKEIS